MLLSDGNFTKGSTEKVSVKCDRCGIVTFTQYCNYYRSQEKRGFPGKTYCVTCSRIMNGYKRKGKTPSNKGVPNLVGRGANHPAWKGGSYIAQNGYRMVLTNRDADNKWKCYEKEHVVVAEKMLGRELVAGESVHHIDGDKLNNSECNLWVTDNAGHKNAHQSLQRLGYELIRKGLIAFDGDKGEYRWADEARDKL